MGMARPMGRGQWVLVLIVLTFFGTASAWGYYFDERREMSLSGFAYTRGTWALSNDEIGNYKGLWQRGNLVQHRNFLTLEWRHKLERISREFPTLGPFFQFLNFDDFDYYLSWGETDGFRLLDHPLDNNLGGSHLFG
jgi:hypothetical protein